MPMGTHSSLRAYLDNQLAEPHNNVFVDDI